jgi:hypothetical protein
MSEIKLPDCMSEIKLPDLHDISGIEDFFGGVGKWHKAMHLHYIGFNNSPAIPLAARGEFMEALVRNYWSPQIGIVWGLYRLEDRIIGSL